MAAAATITAKARTEFGKGPNRRLRATGQVPGIVYQPGGDSLPFSADSHELFMLLSRGHGRREVVEIVIDGQAPISALFKDWQLDPVRGEVSHVDFSKVDQADIARVNAEQIAEQERIALEREAEVAAAAANVASEEDLVTPTGDDAAAAPEEPAAAEGQE
jgi:large subunit ribosomal protein L25